MRFLFWRQTSLWIYLTPWGIELLAKDAVADTTALAQFDKADSPVTFGQRFFGELHFQLYLHCDLIYLKLVQSLFYQSKFSRPI